MVEIVVCKKAGFWERKLLDGDADFFLKEGVVFDGLRFEVRKLTVEHGDKAGNYIYAVEPGLTVYESQIKGCLGIKE